MRTHSEIIAGADVERIAKLRSVSVHTVRSWAQRNSIPGEHWADLAMAGFTTLEELAIGAKQRARPEEKRPFPTPSEIQNSDAARAA